MDKIKIRPAKSADIPVIAQTVVRAWQVAYRHILPDALLDNLSTARAAARWSELIKDQNMSTLVAEFDGKVVGFVRLGAGRDADIDSKMIGEIYAIYVHPDYWSLGAGRALLYQAIKQLRQRDFQEVTLWTLRDNLRARTFYEQVGLAFDGATKETDRGGVSSTEVRYRRKL